MRRIEKLNLNDIDVFNALRSTFKVNNSYFKDEETSKSIYHIDMDFVYNSIPISLFVLFNSVTGKIEAGKTIVVWTNKKMKMARNIG